MLDKQERSTAPDVSHPNFLHEGQVAGQTQAPPSPPHHPAMQQPRQTSSGLWNAWFRFALPHPPQNVWNLGPEERDWYRRGKLLAQVLLVSTVAGGLACVLIGLQTLGAPTTTDFIDVAAALLLTICMLLAARLNHHGHVEVAGLLAGSLIMLVVAIATATTDLAYAGFDWIDTPSWDLMALGVAVIALTQKPLRAWLSLLLYAVLLLSYIFVIPRDPHLLQVDVTSGMAGNFPQPFQLAGLLIDLLYRPAIISFFLAYVGVIGTQGVLEALRDRDVQEDIAHQQENLIRQMDEIARIRRDQQAWTTKCIARLEGALSRRELFIPPDLPSTWKGDRDLLAYHRLLTNVGRRLADGQAATAAVLVLEQNAQRLPVVLQQQRATGARAEGIAPPDELLLLTSFPNGTGYPPADAYLAALHFFIRELVEEEIDATNALATTIYEVGNGAPTRHIDDWRLLRRFGALAHALNWLFEHVQVRPTIPKPHGPFDQG